MNRNYNVKHITSLLNRYRKSGKHWKASELIKEMYGKIKMDKYILSEILSFNNDIIRCDEEVYCGILNDSVNVWNNCGDNLLGKLLLKRFYCDNDVRRYVSIYNGIRNCKSKVEWYNKLMKLYVNNDMYKEAKELFFNDGMKEFRNKVSYLIGLNMLVKLNDVENGKIVLDKIIEKGWDCDKEMQTVLIRYFGMVNEVESALKIFDEIKNKDVIVYTAMIRVLNNNKMYDKALEIYLSDSMESMEKDVQFYVFILHSCAKLKDEINGNRICDDIKKRGFDQNMEINVEMVNYYGCINNLSECERIFHQIQSKNIIIYNTMIRVYANNKRHLEALNLFLSENVSDIKNNSSYLMAIECCKYLNDYDSGYKIYQEIASNNIDHIELNTELINFFGYFNDIINAEKVFNNMTNKNIITYNCMITCYINNEKYQKSIGIIFQ